MGARKYMFEVNGIQLGTDDEVMDGRQIRSAANLTPASNYQLIQVSSGFAHSVGLEEPIKFETGSLLVFRAFESDRVFSFTLDERGWEWGTSKINEAELRDLAKVDDDDILVLDGKRDEVVEAGADINLGPKGVEHISVERPKKITVIVNGREHEVDPGLITFEQLLVLAFTNPPTGPNIYYTVTFRKGPRQRPEGSLQPSESVRVKKGMIFNVRSTDKS